MARGAIVQLLFILWCADLIYGGKRPIGDIMSITRTNGRRDDV